MADIKNEVAKIFEKYNGTMTNIQFVGIWSELAKFNIGGFPLMGTRGWETLPDGTQRLVSPLQYKDGSNTDFKIVLLVTEHEFTNTYSSYVA